MKTSTNAFTTESRQGNTSYTNFSKGKTAFKRVVFEFKNTAHEDRIINFKKFHLLDSENNKYYVKYALQNLKPTTNWEKLQRKLKAGKTRKFVAEFWPPFPKNDSITTILFKNKKIHLENAE